MNNLKAFKEFATNTNDKQSKINEFFKDFLIYHGDNIRSTDFCDNIEDAQRFIIKNNYDNYDDVLVLVFENEYLNIKFKITGKEFLIDYNLIYFQISDHIIQKTAESIDAECILKDVLNNKGLYNEQMVADFCYHAFLSIYDYKVSANENFMKIFNKDILILIDEIMLKQKIIHNTVEFTIKEFWRRHAQEFTGKEHYKIGDFYKMDEDTMSMLQFNGFIGA